jgi:phage terminase large subunit-like protein
MFPGCRIALVAATFADGRDTMVEGESGLLAVLEDSELRGGSQDLAWNRSMGELFLANGSRFKVYSSEKPRQLRGPQHHFAWCDEAAAWLDAHKGTLKDTTWSNLLFGLRLPGQPGWPPEYRTRVIVTTTPRPVALIKVSDSVLESEPHRAGILQRISTVTTRGSTKENLANLSEEFKSEVIDPIAGTSLARQELEAEIVEDTDGALVRRTALERCRVSVGEVYDVLLAASRVVSVDPATTTGETSDETGICVVSYGYDGHIYVLGDHSGKGTPEEWAFAVWAAVYTYRVGAIVVEDNQGGDMCEHVLRTSWHTFVTLWARDPERAAWALTWDGDAKSIVGETARSRGRASEKDRIDALVAPAPRYGLVMPPIHRVHPSGPNSGKWIRAQPLRLLYEQGRLKHVQHPEQPAHFAHLEDQLTSWTGQRGEKSPDRVDALAHAVDFLFHPAERARDRYAAHPAGRRWVDRSRGR